MDYQFYFDERGRPAATLDADYAIFGEWLTDDIGQQSELLSTLINALAIPGSEFTHNGNSFIFQLSEGEVTLERNGDDFHSSDEWQESDLADGDGGTNCAGCGQEDLLELMQAWQDFLH